MELHKDLPPLMTLRAFEAVARHLSFINAARELSLTQSALSHQVQKLEDYLNVRLFVRRTRAIDLTRDGSIYYRHIRQALERIAEGTREIRGIAEKPGVLRIGLLASFATLWLAPRLAGFIANNPDIYVELVPSFLSADVAGGEVDLSIRYGKGGWANVDERLLMPERLFPVCSPAYKAALEKPLKTPADLRHGPLLVAQTQVQFEWIDWSRHYRVDVSKVQSVMLHDYNIVVEAAVSGQGIAMGREHLIQRRLREGALVELFDDAAYQGEIGYWLITPPKLISREAGRFVDWLVDVTQEQ